MAELRGRLICTVDGVPTPIEGFDALHGTGRPVATGSVTFPLPLPPHLRGGPEAIYGRNIVVQAGFDQTVIRPRLVGTLVEKSFRIERDGRSGTFSVQGHAAKLARPFGQDMHFWSHVPLQTLFEAYAWWMGLPAWQVDAMTYPDGVTPVELGGNGDILLGGYMVPGDTNILDLLGRKARLFGYRGFETPGQLRVQRVSGLPVGSVHETYVEGVNCYDMADQGTSMNVVNDNRVEGATFLDRDGVTIPVRSFAQDVPVSPYIPGGYRVETQSDPDLVRQDLADAVRNVAEIDKSEPDDILTWRCRGRADLYPGDVVEVVSPTFGVSGRRWLTEVREHFDKGSYVTTLTGWAGMGRSLAAGTDAVFVDVPGTWHVGDEYLAHYRVPSPSGSVIEIPFDVPGTYTSIAVSFLGHGTNSLLLDGSSADSKVSKIEAWQGGDKPVGSAELPVMPEDLERHYPYGPDNTYWQRARMPVPGRLDPGRAVLKIVSGEHADGGGRDDFEITGVRIELRGTGVPDYVRR